MFSEMAQPILMAKINVIEGTKEVLKKKTPRTHSAHKKGMKKIIKIF